MWAFEQEEEVAKQCHIYNLDRVRSDSLAPYLISNKYQKMSYLFISKTRWFSVNLVAS